ncbi:MAG TPA: adenosylcobalamin-dependent ribonucleoside-diphosphate reductase [Verrucomicrobiae bacterium]|nr:adenosylcobalamin-dependent ribonucleoside-diphosphate reductase [Verrucomicrobiae bacterium]
MLRRDAMNLSDLAIEVLRKRILLTDASGQPRETPEEMFVRVANAVASVERRYGGSGATREIADSFRDLMQSLDFLPNSPTLVNAGLPNGQLSGCFVLPIEDSMDSIFGTLRDMALIQKTGGGTGFSFSHLRPRNDPVGSARGRSSGPVSFMKLYDYASETTRLGGARRGANMGVLRFDHPDILEFIACKSDPGALHTFNISVAVTESFMDSVKRKADYGLINPRTGQEAGRVNARQVFDAMVDSAWKTGDPGIVFLDAINRENPVSAVGEIEATNPCGEQPLLAYESCNLGSINASRFVRDSKIDFARLGSVVRLAVRFLDDVVDANHYPLPQIEEQTLANRKIGLGIMGFADLLFLLGIPYDSQRAIALADELMGFVAEEAKSASCGLAERRGTFPNYARSSFAARGAKRRNAAVTTIAPTGTISLIAGCSSGIEPLFALSFVRHVLEERREFHVHPVFEEAAAAYLTAEIRNRILATGSAKDVNELPESVRRIFVTAHDIEPEWHVRMQAAFQRHVESAVSKTVNMRRTATRGDIEKVFLLAHELGCKGITVFRDGCKSEQVLEAGKPEQQGPVGVEPCPECGGMMAETSGCVTCLSCGYAFCVI